MKDDDMISWFVGKFMDEKLPVHAAHIAFFILASLLPFLMFLITLLHYTPLTESFAMESAKSIIPAGLHGFFDRIMVESSSAASGTLSLTVIAALWAGSKGFYGIILGLENIYKANMYNIVTRRLISIFYTLIFTVIIILSLVILVYGNQIIIFLLDYIPFSSDVAIVRSGIILRSAFYFIFMNLFFVLMYRFLPRHKSTLFAEFPGAILSTFLWMVFSYLYSFYIDKYGSSLSLYGSLTSLVFLMIWLYFCMNIIFIGALFNVYIARQKAKNEKLHIIRSILHLPKLLLSFLGKNNQ